MKILFSTLPAFGHAYPLMPLARAARAAGHDVRFATAAPFTDRVEAAGFTAYDVGMSIEEARSHVLSDRADGLPVGGDGRPDMTVGIRMFLDVLAPRTAEDLQPLLDDLRPDVLVHESFELGSAVVAAARGIPVVNHLISPRLPDEVLNGIAAPHVARLWERFGDGSGEPLVDVFAGDVAVDIIPSLLQRPDFLRHPARVPVRPAGFAEPGAHRPDWIERRDPRRPLVYLTLGTVVATDEHLRAAVDGLARLDADVLVALGSAPGSDLPEHAGVHVEEFVDQPFVLAHTDLAVHHAGSGTTIAALAGGVHQVLLPKGADQFFNSDALRHAGAATVIEPADATADAIATAAADALNRPLPGPATAARREITARATPAQALGDILSRALFTASGRADRWTAAR